MKHRLALERVILRLTKYLLSNVLLNYCYVKAEDCSAHLSIIVKHSTRSTGQPYGKKLISCGWPISGKVLRVILNMYKSIKSCVMANGMQSELFESHV